MKKNLNLRLFIVAIMVIGGLFLMCSCASKSGHRVVFKNSTSRFKPTKVTDSTGVSYIFNVDTLLKKGEIIRVNGIVYAIQ